MFPRHDPARNKERFGRTRPTRILPNCEERHRTGNREKLLREDRRVHRSQDFANHPAAIDRAGGAIMAAQLIILVIMIAIAVASLSIM
jgi:hypothetical protein